MCAPSALMATLPIKHGEREPVVLSLSPSFFTNGERAGVRGGNACEGRQTREGRLTGERLPAWCNRPPLTPALSP